MDVLKRDFGPSDLEKEIREAGIDGVISVQARTDPAENEFLLQFAGNNDFIKGVVGYVDLTHPGVAEQLTELSLKHKKFIGVREVLQGMDDDAYCLRKDFNRGIALLHDHGLVYDVLIFHRHLPNAIKFVDQHPLQSFVLDHIAKPAIENTIPDPAWIKNMKSLGEREHVSCKISGMVTEVTGQKTWSPELLKPYFEVAWEAFGPRRLLFGSDWPVCLLRCGYIEWVNAVTTWTESLSNSEQEAFWGGNAIRIYKV